MRTGNQRIDQVQHDFLVLQYFTACLISASGLPGLQQFLKLIFRVNHGNQPDTHVIQVSAVWTGNHRIPAIEQKIIIPELFATGGIGTNTNQRIDIKLRFAGRTNC